MMRFLMPIFLVFGSMSMAASAWSFEPVSLVVPGHVEFEQTPTSMRFEAEWQDYGAPSLEQFLARKSLDPSEAAFADLMGSLRAGDVQGAEKLLRDPKTAASDATVPGKVERWREGFAGFRNVDVVGRARLGELELFLWQVARPPKEPYIRAFSLRGLDGGEFHAEMVSSKTPVRKLVLEALEKKLREPSRYGVQPMPRALPGFETYRYPLPMDSGPRVELVFRARAVDFDVLGGSAPDGEILSFYHDAWQHFAAGDFDAFMARYTPGSAAKIRQRLEELTPEQQKAFHQSLVEGRQVWAVVDADPLYLVFHSTGKRASSPESILRYDTVIREANGELKLTNHFYISYFDAVLRDKNLFAATPEELRTRVLGLSP